MLLKTSTIIHSENTKQNKFNLNFSREAPLQKALTSIQGMSLLELYREFAKEAFKMNAIARKRKERVPEYTFEDSLGSRGKSLKTPALLEGDEKFNEAVRKLGKALVEVFELLSVKPSNDFKTLGITYKYTDDHILMYELDLNSKSFNTKRIKPTNKYVSNSSKNNR